MSESAPMTSSAGASLTPADASSSAGAADAAPAAAANEYQEPLRDPSHVWEAVDGTSMWVDVGEDADGNILLRGSGTELGLAAQIRMRRRRLRTADAARSSKRLVRHMLRHVYLVLDVSRWSREKDPALPPAKTRLETTLNIASDFVEEYYDQNPLGHLGVVLCKGGEAEMLTALGGSPRKHRLALGAALVTEMKGGNKPKENGGAPGGEFSLQNGIEVAGRSLGYAPRYGSREIVLILSALATCDPGDILHETLPRLQRAGIRVSAVCLQAEMHVCKKIAEATGGLAGVPINSQHLRDLVMGHAIPPPANPAALASGGADEDNDDGGVCAGMICEFVTMGFPSREGGDIPTLVHSMGGNSKDSSAAAFAVDPAAADDRRSNRLVSFARTGYACPRCRSRCADLPSDCAVCGLRLVSAPHLARTFHHLFPVRPFEEFPEWEAAIPPEDSGSDEKGAEPVLSNGNSAVQKPPPLPTPVVSSSQFTPIAEMSMSMSSSAIRYVVSSAPTSSSEFSQNGHAANNLSSSSGAAAACNSATVTIDPSLATSSADCDRCCFGCLKIIGCRLVDSTVDSTDAGRRKKRGRKKKPGPKNGGKGGGEEGEAELRFLCPECRNVFCADCDAYLHETLHNCPGCLCT